MASDLDLIRRYRKYIEQDLEDEQKILKSIDKLLHLDVTVQHLQETLVGHTVNALSGKPGDVGHAARALVYKWKCMVAAEENDQEEGSSHNGHGSGKDSDDNSRRLEKCSKSTTSDPQSRKYTNGTKRKYHSREEKNDTKKAKYSSSAESEHHKGKIRSSSKHHGVDKHRSSSQKTDREREKHGSSTHTSDKSTEKDKIKDKLKSTNEKQIGHDKHKSKDSSSSSSSKDKSSSGKEKSKHSSSSSKDKSSNHRSDKKHSSSNEKSKGSDKNTNEKSTEKVSSHKSSSSSQKSKSSSSKSKEDVPKKDSINSENIGDGIDCSSGASFADVLEMIIPTKSRVKKSTSWKENHGSSIAGDIDTSPVSLLSPRTKLAPLAPLPPLEISALSEISPNYKPRPPPKFLPRFPDDDAMSAFMSSKKHRTKVYSGNKTCGKVPKLYERCIQTIQENIDALESTGGVPYEVLKPVLEKATAEQLFKLEHFNPYLLQDTDVQWQKFCEKNFRNKKRQEPETWREMYLRCQEEQKIKLRSLTANIRIAQEAKKAPNKQTKMAYTDTVVKPPRNIARKQAQHSTAFATTASPAARVSSLANTSNVLKENAGFQPAPPARPKKKAPLMQKVLRLMGGRRR